MPLSIENLLLLMGGDFKFYCLQLKISSGFDQNFSVFLRGDESLVYSSNGDKVFFSPGSNWVFNTGYHKDRGPRDWIFHTLLSLGVY